MENRELPGPIEFDFVEAVANCVHDLKNSSAVMMDTAESIRRATTNPAVAREAWMLQEHAQRINQDLLHLLGCYKLQHAGHGVFPIVVECAEFLRELESYNIALFEARELRFDVHCDENIEGYFDRDLVFSILNAAINNSQRFAARAVRVSCTTTTDHTVFSVADDGTGFAPALLDEHRFAISRSTAFSNSTGLGLYFAEQIAKLHSNNGLRGRVSLANDGIDGGGNFRIWLP
ncbi:MAG: signal transduction histidine kinase [Gammaproteobacteria bacterium]|jgi:signal transduction histidine kinase